MDSSDTRRSSESGKSNPIRNKPLVGQMDARDLVLWDGWLFRQLDEEGKDSGAAWEEITIPHNPFVATLDGPGNWVGLCEYKRELLLENTGEDELFFLYFGAAMQSARVFLDDTLLIEHHGGYLPFEAALPEWCCDGKPHTLRVWLDNRWDPSIPPGKPYEELDFCCYGGLYRPVVLKRRSGVYITDPVNASQPGAGGVLLQTRAIDADGKAKAYVQVEVKNTTSKPRTLELAVQLNAAKCIVTLPQERSFRVDAGATEVYGYEIELSGITGWTPLQPKLYPVTVAVKDAQSGECFDRFEMDYGFRIVEISQKAGLRINGQRFRFRGCNRHQDHPYVGYALSDEAQFRDAVRIKEAGFDYVRLSHYPQSPAFLRACDQLGILVMNCIPGWQQLTDQTFREHCIANAREMIRRDRNHPCVVLWELSLNETEMDAGLIRSLHSVGTEEYPGGKLYTCGWMPGYDVYLRARQHGRLHETLPDDQALVVSEYGDWEYYASNEGFDQKTGRGLLDLQKNSRVPRGEGAVRLLQQVRNHHEALIDTLESPAVLDGLWSMFDYPRGYHARRAVCGVMDVFRIPKWSYHFYRSQRDPNESCERCELGAVLFVASYWTGPTDGPIWVFSNLDTVELWLNGKKVGTSTLDPTQHRLPHPPHLFRGIDFEPGLLEARAQAPSGKVIVHQVRTPGSPVALQVETDFRNCKPGSAGSAEDLIFVHAMLVDENGTLCVEDSDRIQFTVTGVAQWIGPDEVDTEAGIAAGLIRIRPSALQQDGFQIRCVSESGLEGCYRF